MSLQALEKETRLGSDHAPETVVELMNVVKSYAEGNIVSRALDGVSFTLGSGEIVALLGPNGAGKTTAIRILLGLTRQTTGQARVFGLNPKEHAVRMRVGAMLQVGRVPESLRVREHVDLFRRYYPRPLALAEILQMAGIDGIAEKLFGELSGGQKQRVLFAIALAGDPDLVFLDEPSLGMDIEARRALWAAVRGLAARGKTVLLTTHYLEEAEALASRIVVMKEGRVVADGTPSALKAKAGSSRILCCVSLEESVLREVPGVSAVFHDGERWSLTTDEPEKVLRAVFAMDRNVSRLEVAPMPFEEAFLALTSSKETN